MRFLLTASAITAAGLAAPVFPASAWAQEPTTLQNITTKGIVVKFPGVDVDVAYLPDGKFVALNGTVTGTWRIEGEALCAKSTTDEHEACTVYPAGKKPGDEFSVNGPQGPVTIQINE